MPDPAVMPATGNLPVGAEEGLGLGARPTGGFPVAPELAALGYLARLGMELCSAELRGRTAALMRGELDGADARRTVNDLGLMASAVSARSA